MARRSRSLLAQGAEVGTEESPLPSTPEGRRAARLRAASDDELKAELEARGYVVTAKAKIGRPSAVTAGLRELIPVEYDLLVAFRHSEGKQKGELMFNGKSAMADIAKRHGLTVSQVDRVIAPRQKRK